MNKSLVWAFYMFGFTALIFEPLYYFGCHWNLHQCALSNYEILHLVGKVWAIYTQWDPLFIMPPLWLKILCTIECFMFGPLYIATAYGIQNDSNWLSFVALPFCGALIYSTIVYFAMEVLDPLPGTNMAMVFLINIPWTIVPMLLIGHISVEVLTCKQVVINKNV